MEKEVFMKGYLNKGIKITFLDNLQVRGVYINYYYFNNVLVIVPADAHDDTRILIPMSAIKMIEPCEVDDYDVLDGVGELVPPKE